MGKGKKKTCYRKGKAVPRKKTGRKGCPKGATTQKPKKKKK